MKRTDPFLPQQVCHQCAVDELAPFLVDAFMRNDFIHIQELLYSQVYLLITIHYYTLFKNKMLLVEKYLFIKEEMMQKLPR